MYSQMLIPHLRYHRWATEQVLQQAQALDAERQMRNLQGSFGTLYDTLAHLFQADSIWLDRLEGKQLRSREEYGAPGCTYDLGDAWLKVIDRMIQLAEEWGEDDWNGKFAFKLLNGTPYENVRWQVIMHVVNHGTHHRGQITHMLRQLGEKPLGLDLIRFYRDHPEYAEVGAPQLQS
jgi:uncharacterized damage-inducible protein DinB